MAQRIAAGIDVSSTNLVVAVEGNSKIIEFPNDEPGRVQLVEMLKASRVTRLGIEPTGTYGFDAMIAIHAAGIEVISINPSASRSFAKANMRRGKTDKVDAGVLLEFTLRMEAIPWAPPPEAIIQLRMITRRLEQIIKDGAAEKARLASHVSPLTPAVVLESIERSIKQSRDEAKALEDAALELARTDPRLAEALEVFTSVRGIADRTAIKLLGELAAMPEDLTPRQLVAMAGLDPRPFESGNSKGKRRISKWGNAHMRGILYMAAFNAVRWEPVAKELFDALRARGKHRMQALVAVMRKLLHSLWAMFRNRKPFDPKLFRPDFAAAA